jgi:2'-5' RNA ligase
MAILRAFIAVELDGALHAALDKVQRRLRAEPISGFVRWVAPESIHLTLKFLGEMDAARTPHVLAAMKSACSGIAPFELVITGAGCFPNFQRPNVVWAGLIGHVQQATQLAQRIESECAKLGFEPEERPFSPHLTLGRVKRDIAPFERRQVGDLIRRLDIGRVGLIRANTVHLMRSELKPTGAIYTSLGHVELH